MQDKRTQPRRTKLPNRRGIYYRLGADGKRQYEITYTDSDGKQRWQRVEGGVEAAQAARDELLGTKRKGGRVAPTRLTFGELAEVWLNEQTSQLRPRTVGRYRAALNVQVIPRLGKLRLVDVNEDDVARLISEMTVDGKAAWTIRTTLTPLSRIFDYAVRRGMCASNPVKGLERGERPRVERRELRVLDSADIQRLLAACDGQARTLLGTMVFTGTRIGEALGLVWGDVDFDAGRINVRYQLSPTGERVAPKTGQAVRAIVLMPTLGQMLREHRAASGYSQDSDFVFVSSLGTPLNVANVRNRWFADAVETANLNKPGLPRLRLHDLRHAYASLLIAQGADVVFVSRMLGHANPSITLGIYAHLFDAHRHADDVSAKLEADFGEMLSKLSSAELVEANADVIDMGNRR